MSSRRYSGKYIAWSLYLVTDSTPAILGDKDIVDVVQQAIRGGVGVVQYREKHADTGMMIEVASRIHAVTQRYKIPLLINDRLDVCQAVGAEGVHIGQDDIDIVTARDVLGPDAIIGVTASSPQEAKKAINDGADYLGIGTTFATPTKTDTKHIIGTRGLQEILDACDTGTEKSIPCVAIGSINCWNVQRVLHQSAAGTNGLNGVAVVSAIVASSEPETAARYLLECIKSAPTSFYTSVPPSRQMITNLKDLLSQVPSVIQKHVSSNVLCHNMTNTVVQNFVANVCLATGSSPIMSDNGAEAADLAQLDGALVINMGTATPDKIEAFIAGMRAYDSVGSPVVFDPVGGGATTLRRNTVKTLLGAGFFSVIKGNEGEISAVAGLSNGQQHGVDSGPSNSTANEKAKLVRNLARREHAIILMTGKTDYLSDGTRTLAINNGSPWLGRMTGSGCALGAVVASYMAVHPHDKFLGVLAGVLHYELAAEWAEREELCKGPGSFGPVFLDMLYKVGKEVGGVGDGDWGGKREELVRRWAKVEVVDV